MLAVKIMEGNEIINMMENRIFQTANRLKVVPNIARAVLIKNVWSKKLSLEAFDRDPDYIKNTFGFTVEEADERNLQFMESSKVTCPVCYEEVDVNDSIIIEECGHFACIDCMRNQCMTKLDSGSEVVNTFCVSCTLNIPPEVFEKVLDAKQFKKF